MGRQEALIRKAEILKDERPHGCHNPFCNNEMDVSQTAHRPAYTELWVCGDCYFDWISQWPKWIIELQKRNGKPV